MNRQPVQVIGGGLAGCEAAWALANAGIAVELYEMRPNTMTPAHQTGDLAELVCSNSFRGNERTQAPGLLKREMAALGSLVIQAAKVAEVPAGNALAVDRHLFSQTMTQSIAKHPKIKLIKQRIDSIPSQNDVIIASGPLTDQGLYHAIEQYVGQKHLAFYDAIAPIVSRDSIDWQHAYIKDRWQDDPTATSSYINCPLDQETYAIFVDKLLAGPFAPYKTFEENIRHFEGCLPIEEMAARGPNTLRYGPMKPVGLRHPITGKSFYAVVQLRPDNRSQSLLNMVGFQTKMTYGAQKEAFQIIPALKNAEFIRLGSLHRNTFINSPQLLNTDLSLKQTPHIHFAGQITGVEGYIESASMGIIAGLAIACKYYGQSFTPPPATTAIGALAHYISDPVVTQFQPMNINFGLLTPLEQTTTKPLRGEQKREALASRALTDLAHWLQSYQKFLPSIA